MLLSALASYLLSSAYKKNHFPFSPESFCSVLVSALQNPCRLQMGLIDINRQLEFLEM